MKTPSRRSLIGLLLSVAVLSGCPNASFKKGLAPVVHSGGALPPAWPSVALAPTVFLEDLEGAVVADPFADNLTIGNIWFSGGYELLAEVDNQVRSVKYEVDHVAEYRASLVALLDTRLGRALDAHGLQWSRLDAPITPPTPRRALVRGTGPLDGADNQNLPRVDFEPRPLPTPPGDLPGQPQLLLVPVVVHYYSHNGGWFVGQEEGCPAGARFRLLWTLYDAHTGAVVGWRDLETRTLQRWYYSPNRTEIQDYLIRVEDDVVELFEADLPPAP